ncbi:hypothetical protein DPEC_G00022360 [Dallia pectoralis]|uniref:Uncharacterized protein n=1 Tax=Dallia pectoralis TaxID=75939 RepID=A0ACC2HH64_DALPE|nr:hypothetical protein DPEC_G00022360 [Dallia pectoralis]
MITWNARRTDDIFMTFNRVQHVNKPTSAAITFPLFWKTRISNSIVTSCEKMKDPSRINNSPNLSNIDVVIQHGQLINDDNPFAEYMWMENEDEFNRQIEEELWEEEFIEQCFQEMLEEEEYEWFIPARDLPSTLSLMQEQLHLLVVSDTCITDGLVIQTQHVSQPLDWQSHTTPTVNSNLNPEAQEFIPRLKH